MRDRRFDARWTLAEKVDLRWQDASGVDVHGAAIMHDLSASGAQVHSNRTIPVQTPVTVAFQGKEVRATVRYCVRAHNHCVLGIEFLPEYQGILRPPSKTGEAKIPVSS